MKTIYVFGDSHGMMFSRFVNGIKNETGKPYISKKERNIKFIDVSCGSFTCYSLHTHDKEIRTNFNAPTRFVPEGSTVWFLFGEIDARYRISAEHKKTEKSIGQVVDSVVKNYLDYVEKFKEYRIFVVSVVPTVRTGKWERILESSKIKLNSHSGGWLFPTRIDISSEEKETPIFVVHGVDVERRYITEILNAKLKLECTKRKIPFIDLYPLLVDVDGFNNPDLLRQNPKDGLHYGYIGDLVLDYLDWEEGECG